jgi:hypothetical protein
MATTLLTLPESPNDLTNLGSLYYYSWDYKLLISCILPAEPVPKTSDGRYGTSARSFLSVSLGPTINTDADRASQTSSQRSGGQYETSARFSVRTVRNGRERPNGSEASPEDLRHLQLTRIPIIWSEPRSRKSSMSSPNCHV